jgi:hypothetical protein
LCWWGFEISTPKLPQARPHVTTTTNTTTTTIILGGIKLESPTHISCVRASVSGNYFNGGSGCACGSFGVEIQQQTADKHHF